MENNDEKYTAAEALDEIFCGIDGIYCMYDNGKIDSETCVEQIRDAIQGGMEILHAIGY